MLAMLDWLFAPSCAACGTPTRDPLCEACSGSLDELGVSCPYCAEPTGDQLAALVGDRAVSCRRCARGRLPLDRIASPWRFGGQLAVAIRRLKHAGRTDVARTIAPLWAPLVAAAARPDAVVVPVPSHWRRRLSRGFDHAWLLAVHACRWASLPRPVAALRRTRAAPPQSTLPAAERRANLRGVFAIRDPRSIAGRAIVLVDDVATTGTTLAECARTLRAGGASSVVGVVLARATSAPG